MQADATLVAYRENVVPVANLVFETMLRLEIKPYLMPWTRPQDMISAAVYFAGAWYGAILLECSPLQARRFAQYLMSLDEPEAVNDDVRDALGELANMLAGNLKSVLPHGVVLSMPSVVEGSDYVLQMCGKRTVERIPFWSRDGIFAVTLVETFDRGNSIQAGARN